MPCGTRTIPKTLVANRMKAHLIVLILVLNASFCIGQNQKEFRMCFYNGSSELSEEDESQILAIAHMLQEPDFTYMKIFGYATEPGSEMFNTELSKRRAFAVYDKIRALHSIDETRIYVTWLGESEDVYDLHYDNSRPQTPCVEVIVQLNKQ